MPHHVRVILAVIAFGLAQPLRAAEPDGPAAVIDREDAISIAVMVEVENRKDGITKAERGAMIAFYGQLGAPLLWVDGRGPTARARELVEQIGGAREYGLEPGDYDLPIEGFEQIADRGVASTAALEVRYALAALGYARHASSGRLDTTKLGEFIDPTPTRADPAALLADIARGDKGLGQLLLAYHPVHEQFWALKDALAKARGGRRDTEAATIPDGENIFPGDSDAAIPAVRARLKVAAEDPDEPELYDETLEAAVRTFQRGAGLRAEGIIGPNTREALNGRQSTASETQILANMERWRWMPRSFGERHVWVNIPEYLLRLQNGAQVEHEERIVVGTPKNKTPIFSDEMETVVINPYWTVPESIITKEILPIAQRNPGYIARQRMEIFYGGRLRNIDPYEVNWSNIDPTKLTLRQTPGYHNALGNIKFEFPNRHAVYMHDTPQKSLFSSTARAFSHGCMRVRNPREFAEILLREQGWTMQRIERAIATGDNMPVKMTRKLPVHMMYFTLWAGGDGQLRRFKDVYDYDDMVSGALRLADDRGGSRGRRG